MFTAIIVDDEINIRHGLEKALDWSKLGFEIIGTARDGIEALLLVEKLNPSLVITDIKMPRMDGLALSGQLKSINPDIQIIIISGYRDFDYAREAIRFDVVDYLLKPIDFSELSSVLGKIHKSLSGKLLPEETITEKSERGKGRIREVLVYLQSNSQTDINLKKLAEMFYFNPVYLGQLFKSETGKHFHDFVNELRIEQATKLIREGDLCINEIIDYVGYKNYDHFYKSFKKVTGLNPGEYKKRNQSNKCTE